MLIHWVGKIFPLTSNLLLKVSMEKETQNSDSAPPKEIEKDKTNEKSETQATVKSRVTTNNYKNMIFFTHKRVDSPPPKKEEKQETSVDKPEGWSTKIVIDSPWRKKDTRSDFDTRSDTRSEKDKKENPQHVIQSFLNPYKQYSGNFVQNNMFINSMYSYCKSFVSPQQQEQRASKKRTSKKKKANNGRLFKSDGSNCRKILNSDLSFKAKCDHLAKSLQRELTVANSNVARITSILQSVQKLENNEEEEAPSQLVKVLNTVRWYDESRRFHKMLYEAEQAHNGLNNSNVPSFRQKCFELKFRLGCVAKSAETEESKLIAIQLLDEIQNLRPADCDRKHLKVFEEGLRKLSKNYKDAELSSKVKETYEKIKTINVEKKF